MRRFYVTLAALTFGATASGTANAAVIGFVEDFNNGLNGWAGGGGEAIIMGGGVDGAGDSYLETSRDTAGFLGKRGQTPELIGDLVADGVTGYRIWLNDTGADQALEIHFGVGNRQNFWQYDVPFFPPEGQWQAFEVDLTDTANWTQIIGGGTFAAALAGTDRILIRHDVAPFGQQPDAIVGEFGIDSVEVLPEPSALVLLSLGGLATLRRR